MKNGFVMRSIFIVNKQYNNKYILKINKLLLLNNKSDVNIEVTIHEVTAFYI
jgi:hypothetical protein